MGEFCCCRLKKRPLKAMLTGSHSAGLYQVRVQQMYRSVVRE
ncbi:hypothetical protein BVRB_022080 [Beta vulgaris subsp. vulgaris]|uniref:Uncharacterized protein n=1 Tax=Beta vulgaris subsp. vulgaris TaxID=3555 RepID=A0A0J8B071_BETVV|nr:hypothetical protein BVRB_022080 [Beta vulgaris subsp. vulgaris]